MKNKTHHIVAAAQHKLVVIIYFPSVLFQYILSRQHNNSSKY